MTEPRVLLITGEYPPMPGGVADYTCLLRPALESRQIQATVLSARGSDADESVTRWDWRTVSAVRDAVKRHLIDVVHIQYQAGAFGMHPAINLLPRQLNDTPVVTTFHDLRPPYLFPKAGNLRYFLMRRMARWSSAVIVTNPADRNSFIKGHVIPQMIPLGPSLPAPSDRVERRSLVGYFGFPSRQKGFDLLICAVGRIPQQNRPGILIVGGHPPDGAHHGFMTRAEVDGIADQSEVTITWAGHLEAQAASNALASCAVLAFPFPSGATQRSSALIAALQTGQPVITTTPRISGSLGTLAQLPQLVQVDAADAELVRDALIDSMNRTTPAEPLPHEYQWDSIAARHANLYRSLIQEVGG